jgi:BASS family bile acid:Na+ symporter
LHIDYIAVARTLLVVQILPLAVGLAVHRRAPKLAMKCANPVGRLANLLLVIVLVLILVAQYETLSAIRLRGWSGMLVLLAASLGIGWALGGPTTATRKTLALTTAARNAAVGLVIVSANFPGTPAVTAVVAYALVSVLGALVCALALKRGRGALLLTQ